MRTLKTFLIAGLIAAGAASAEERTVTIGFVGKNLSNPVFKVAHLGAQDAAQKFGEKFGVNVVIDHQTPPQESASKQVETLGNLIDKGVDGIAVSCSDAGTLTPAINRAVQEGILVMTFDSDAPDSGRFNYFGASNEEWGSVLMKQMAKLMDGEGSVAILAGSESAANLRERLKGALDEAAKHPGIKIVSTVHHNETPDEAAQALQRAQKHNPGIQGWVMLGGWALSAPNALPWEPGTVKVISQDALPEQLHYVESGHVQRLLAQDYYGWGYKSVWILLNKLINDDAPGFHTTPIHVTQDNLAEYREKWDGWLSKVK